MSFVHLHVHTEYSLLDGLTTPDELGRRVQENKQKACAITDHGSMAGTLAFQEASRKYGFNPIFGCEFYYVPSLNDDDEDKGKRERYHLILLAKNDDGLKKLFKLQRKSWTKGFYYKPRIEFADLEFLAGDVVCLSGCMGGYVSQAILNDDEDAAVRAVQRFKKVFNDDYYLEVQPWNPPILNETLHKLSLSEGIPMVGTIDAHYPSCNEKGVEEILLAVGQASSMNAAQKRHLRDHADAGHKERDLINKMNILFPDRRLTFQEHDVYVMDDAEVVRAFEDANFLHKNALDNTLVIADKCNSKIETGRSLLPSYSKNLDSKMYLRELVQAGLEDYGLDSKPEYIERMDAELADIDELDFNDYFLIIWDIVAWAKKNDIAVGHSRGSVGGCLIAYLLGITSIDPIKYDLLFARFINKERNDYPDIDLDFEDARRGEVKEYIRQRWGNENVASITTYGEYKPKSAVKDVARVFGIDYNLMNDVTKQFETLDELKTAGWAKEFRYKYPDVIPVAERLAGRVKNAGAHAAGVVISNVPLDEVLPLESRDDKVNSGRIEVTSFDMDECAKVGLIKMDILGVKAVTVVKHTIKKIKENYGVDVWNDSLALDDPDVYTAFNSGHLTGIFQAEASAYRNLISEMGIDNFGDLVASNALVRPGALVTQGASYIARKRGKEDVTYPHKILEPILNETYGKFLYQEQLMRAVVDLAGFTWSEADNLRKIIGKKRDEAEFAKWRNQFIEGATKHISEKEAANMWQDFQKSSLYMFNKSHAVGYSLLSYQTMWLKVHYPVEFIWASLYNETEKTAITGFLMEAKRLGVKVLPPDVSYSDNQFTLHDGAIRFGLSNVAMCGPSGAVNIIENRPYRSFDEFMAKTKRTAVKSTLIENLDKVGAFESLGHVSQYDHRNYYLPILSYALEDSDDGEFSDLIVPCAEASRGGWSVVKGVVKSTTRKPHYFRVEVEDSSGIISGFVSDKSAQISSRDYLVAMFNGNNLVAYTDATKYIDLEDDKFVKFMRYHMVRNNWYDIEVTTKDGEGAVGVLLEVRKITSKAGNKFVSINYFDGSEIHSAKVDYEVFKAHEDRFEQFNTVVLKLHRGRGGAKVLDVRLLEEYAQMRNLDVDVYV